MSIREDIIERLYTEKKQIQIAASLLHCSMTDKEFAEWDAEVAAKIEIAKTAKNGDFFYDERFCVWKLKVEKDDFENNLNKLRSFSYST